MTVGKKSRRYNDEFMESEICPCCGKEFVPAPQHSYKVKIGRGDTLVCSYSCVRFWEKEQENSRKRRKKN